MPKNINKFQSAVLALFLLLSSFASPFLASASAPVLAQDYPTLQVSNFTQNPGWVWNGSISGVQPNDIVSFLLYYHNAGDASATNAKASLSFSIGGSSMTAQGTISASNASPTFGSATITPASGVTINGLNFYNAEWYPANSGTNQQPLPYGQSGSEVTSGGVSFGDVAPNTIGYFVARFKVSATTGGGGGSGTNNAACLSVNVPTSVTAGQTFQATVSMQNNGTNPWTIGNWPTGGYYLGSQNPQDNSTWGMGRVDLPFAPVQPNQTANFTFTATAPNVSSQVSQSFSWQMLQESVQWFGAICTRNITVNPRSTGGNPTLVITPATANISVGGSAQLRAYYDADGPSGPQSQIDVTNLSSWNSSNTFVALVSNGNVSGVSAGNATITASYGGLTATAVVTVTGGGGGCTGSCNPTLVITPASASVSVGQSIQLHAYYDPDGPSGSQGQSDITYSATWSSSNYSVASVSQGNVTGVSNGSATITANYAGLTATASVSVTGGGGGCTGSCNPTLVISPANTSVSVGQSVQLHAYYDPDGPSGSQGQSDVTYSASWNSSNSSVATVSQGLARGISNGSATITASYGGLTATAVVTVTGGGGCTGSCNPTLVISPASASVSVGQNTQLHAYYDADGPSGPQAQTDVTYLANWNSSNPAVATVSSGIVNGVSNGSVTITASYGGLTATATVTVTGGGCGTGCGGGTAPAVSTGAATNITQTSATLNGMVNPNGAVTTYWFEYGTSYSLGQTTFNQNAGAGNSNVNASLSVSNLQQNTTYYYRLVGQNQYGTTQGQIMSFTTIGSSGGSATLVITPGSATINVGQNYLFHAYYDPDGSGSQSQSDVTYSASWNSSNSSVATVSQGNVNGVSNGSATITANYAGLTATAVVSVFGGGSQGSAPIVSTWAATNINQNSATLNGSVNPNGANTTYWFEYGTSYSLGNTVGNQSIGSGNNSQNVSFTVYGLQANTTYYFRVVAQNQYGTTQGQILSFNTNTGGCTYNCGGGQAPIVTTNYVSGLNQNSATLNGTVNPNNSNTNYWFEYGQNSGLGQTTGFQFLGSFNYPQNVSTQLNNLLPNMTYYFRVAAQNQYGTSYGSILTFTTNGGGNGNCSNNYWGSSGQNAPCVQTLTPTNISDTLATFNGQITSSGNDSSTAWFEYGTNSNSLTYTTNNTYVPSYASNFNYSQPVSNLISGTTYYVRAVARNSYGTSYGQTYQFTTTGSGTIGTLPLVLTKPASYIGRNSAILNGAANPNGNYGTSWFEYGLTNSLGLRTSAQSLGYGYTYVDMSSALSGLLPGRTYYFRAMAQTPAGISYGAIFHFTTLGGGINPPPTPIATTTISVPSCLELHPALSASSVKSGDNLDYALTYKNNCGYDLSNASLQIVLPLETTFVSSNTAFANRTSNNLSYNLGVVPNNYQATLTIRTTVNDRVEKDDTLLYGSTMNWNDPRAKFNTTSAYITAIVSEGGVSGLASLLAIFSGWGWLWLLLLLLILLAIYWIFFRKEEKTAVQKIESTIS